MNRIRYYMITGLILISMASHAQLIITTGQTPQYYVQNVLLGGGVTASNITYTGQTGTSGAGQIAEFSNGNTTNLGLTSGIVMATGDVTGLAGPASNFWSADMGGGGDPQLDNISGSSTYDAAVLEFDFLPLDNIVSFRYVFGSEEYLEYVGSSYNDAFGFFITGPNPGGGNYTNQNIALIPGTSVPVAINNVHSTSYSQYYVNNEALGGQTIVLDGFTTVLTALANVVPCQSYHIKIAVADAGDHVLDSGVFLEANSFSTDALDIIVTYSSGASAAEGCSQATVTVTIGSPPANNYSVNYTLGGTAVNADFTNNIPTSVVIPAGQTSTSFILNPVLDGLTEGTEYVVFGLPNPCGTGYVYDTVWVSDNTQMTIDAGLDQTICNGLQPVPLGVTVNGGAPNYTYNWSNGAGTTQQVNVSPGVGTTTYTVTVNDACGQTATDQVSVTVNPVPTSPFTVVSPICPNMPSDVVYTGTTAGNATFAWDFSGGTVTGTGQGPYQVTWPNQGTYNVTLTVTENGCTSTTTTQTITVLSPTDPACCGSFSVNAGQDAQVCQLTYTLNAATTALMGQWVSNPPTATFGNSTLPTTTVTVPAPGGSYTFTFTVGNPGCTVSDDVIVSFTQQPVAEAGQGGTVCSHQFQLNGIASVGTGTWTSSPAGATFGNSHAASTSVSVPSDGQYTFTWTEDAGNGCVSSDQVVVGFWQQPMANAGPNDAVCSLSYNLNAQPSVGMGTWTVAGAGSAYFGNANSASTTVTVNMTGQYNFIWTENNNNCISQDTVTVLLTQTPTSEFAVAAIPCFGDNTSVTYTGTGNPLCTYTWSFGGGSAVPGFGYGPHTVSYQNAGTYSISLTVSQNGCTSGITTYSVTQPSQLTSTITVVDIICPNASTGSISATASGGTPFPGGGYLYEWSNGIMGANNPNVQGGAYTVTITDANGCTIVNGGIVNEPPPFIAVSSPDRYICQGETVFLTLFGIGGNPPYTYYWNGIPSPSVISVNPTQDTAYVALIIDDNGCVSNVDTTIIRIAPPVDLILIQNTDYICPGDPVTLTVSINGGIGPPYLLYNQDGLVFSPPVFLNPEQTMVYSVTAEDACGTRDTASVTIHVLEAPPLSFVADTVAGCQPFTVQFLETNPSNGQTYEWDFGDNSNISLTKNPVHVFNDAGVFDVTLTVTTSSGCKTTETKPAFITVYPKPTSRFVWDPQFATLIKPIIQFTSLSTGAAQHYWFFGDGDSASIVHPYHRYPDAGTYIAKLVTVSDRGCTDTAIAQIVIKDDFTIYTPSAFSPDFNAINDVWYVTGHNISPEGFHLYIYDRWGQIMWETDKYNPENPREFGWNGKNKAGNVVKVDTYIWMLICYDHKGNKKEFTGNVTVIR